MGSMLNGYRDGLGLHGTWTSPSCIAKGKRVPVAVSPALIFMSPVLEFLHGLVWCVVFCTGNEEVLIAWRRRR